MQRRPFLAATAGGLALAAGCLGDDCPSDPDSSTDAEWSRPGGDPGNTGDVGDLRIPEDLSVVWEVEAWEIDALDDRDVGGLSTPVVGEDRVYARMGGPGGYPGNPPPRGVAFALSLDDGAERWRVDLGTGFEVETLAVADGFVAATSGNALYGLCPGNDWLWRTEEARRSTLGGGPAIGDGVVYAPAEDPSTHAGGERRAFAAFDAETGEVVGEAEIETHNVDRGPVIADGAAYVAGGGGDEVVLARYA